MEYLTVEFGIVALAVWLTSILKRYIKIKDLYVLLPFLTVAPIVLGYAFFKGGEWGEWQKILTFWYEKTFALGITAIASYDLVLEKVENYLNSKKRQELKLKPNLKNNLIITAILLGVTVLLILGFFIFKNSITMLLTQASVIIAGILVNVTQAKKEVEVTQQTATDMTNTANEVENEIKEVRNNASNADNDTRTNRINDRYNY